MGESVKVKKPVTAKSLNILLTITVVVSALVIVIGILFSQFATKEETGAIDDDNEKTTGALTTVFAVIAIIMLIAYFILLIICFVRSLRFRKLGGAKAIATLSVCAFVFGLIGILIFLVGAMWAAIYLVGFVLFIGTLVDFTALVAAMKVSIWCALIAVGIIGISFVLEFVAMLIGWIGLRNSKLNVHHTPTPVASK